MLIDLGLGLLEYRIRIFDCVIWYDRSVNLTIDKLHDAVNEIPKLCKQFIVVVRNEIPPLELAVSSLCEKRIPSQYLSRLNYSIVL